MEAVEEEGQTSAMGAVDNIIRWCRRMVRPTTQNDDNGSKRKHEVTSGVRKLGMNDVVVEHSSYSAGLVSSLSIDSLSWGY
ncbi:hypothetical protein E2542_SST26637 [Spatholobus suberectus]|nr:hypothetical protein E2542_SST26637 [Spatholobus suberectus]